MDEEAGFDFPDVEGRNKRGKAGKTVHRPGSGGPQLLSKRGVRQLLEDVEGYGGLFTVSVRALCNRKPELYGEPNTELRRSVQNQVTRWKGLSAEGYQLLLQRRVLGHQHSNLSEEIDSQLSTADPPFSPKMSSSLVPRFGSRHSTSINAPTIMSPPGGILSSEELYIQEVLMDTRRFGKSTCSPWYASCRICWCFLMLLYSIATTSTVYY